MSHSVAKKYHAIILGGGASGMMAAITAARNGYKVLLIEHKEKLGKKIYATGNGRCNFTNEDMKEEYFRGDAELIHHTLTSFDEQDALRFFHSLGVLAKSRGGYLYPNSEQASALVSAMTREIRDLLVDVMLDTTIDSVEETVEGFLVEVNGQYYEGRKLLIAVGGLANPKLGSDGSFFPIIKEWGHHFTSLSPALCGLYCNGLHFPKTKGVRADGLVTLLVDGESCASDYGELQFTEYGLSGIPVFQVSRFAGLALNDKREVTLSVNLLPEYEPVELMAELKYRRLMCGEHSTVADFWNGLLHDKLCDPLLEELGVTAESPVVDLPSDFCDLLCERLQNLTFSVTGIRDYEFAQVTAGGIRTEEIHTNTLESKLVPNLYFIGETLDVDAICGGYNLQWAWATGYVAGNQIGV